ncbi:MAG TPA: M48 family metallopeptidase [Candidatus Binatia bacterium]
MTHSLIIGAFLFLFFFEFVVEFGLNELNLAYVRQRCAEGKLPDFFAAVISPEDYEKSVEYTVAKGRFQRWAAIYDALVTLWILFGGALPALDRFARTLAAGFPASAYATGIIFCLSGGLIFSLLSLPIDLYSTFVLEERFGFNKTTPRLYMIDKLKGLVLTLIIGVPFLFGVLWLMDAAGAYWWFWAFLFVTAFQLLLVVLYPTLIAPLFNKFEPLSEGELRQRILELAEQLGFKTSGIFTMDGSRRSAHSNAYFTGLGKAKRIVLFDTLVEQMTVAQAVAVLAHEIGHYKLKHIRRMLVLRSVSLLAGLYVLSLLINYQPLFSAFGFDGPSHHAALVLFSLLSGPATCYLHPLMNYVSRKHEYEADGFAVQVLKDPKPMEEALIKLTIKNLSNLTPHPWYSAYHYSHPTPAERISAIRRELPQGATA